MGASRYYPALWLDTSRVFKALSVVCHVIQSSSSLQLTAMAAGALSRSRGAAGVRTTKGLYFIFTLLCLFCLASSLTTTERLEKAQKMLKKAEEKLERAKVRQFCSLFFFKKKYISLHLIRYPDITKMKDHTDKVYNSSINGAHDNFSLFHVLFCFN
ncbi:uncharacterized protein LOC127379198 isoform X4 [Scomber scombrus]|uniref:Uncharacterized protein LOC127379198 isoform X4 n=1 Tax=Scomber scombrus TaxID=13677 RepID=A0AAV1P8H0_SCOSC